ncbi:arginine-glutamic acid dipeptide repeats protein-like [Hypanus sabinus]|uniref:arginine-glutamic acid dipeptide repeats protein-like n=1 Tax=Hypanus sabinus TaxID=79690 RepID=UPI0028C393D0|nr:arginine-glutamic acid dipeptide repeats protein-like [Hypanus sabinus]XP_059815881.1 arginine-glutamic acid dipeptide repeats protein-like [Hypanus sabinus]
MQVGPIPAESSKDRKKDSVPGHRTARRRVSLESPNSPIAPEGPFPSPGADSNTGALFPLKTPTGQELREMDNKKRLHEGSQTDDDEAERGRHREAKVRVFTCSPSHCDEGSCSAEGEEEEEEEEDGDDDPRDIDQDNRSTSPSTPSFGPPDSDSEEEEGSRSSPSSHLSPAPQSRPLLPPPPALRPLPAPGGNSSASPSRLPFSPSSSSSAHCLTLRCPAAPPPSGGTPRKLGLSIAPPNCSGQVHPSSSPASSLAPSSSSSSACPSPHFSPLPPQPFTGPQAQPLAFSRPVAPSHQASRAYRGYSPSGSGAYPRPHSSPSPSSVSSPSPSAPPAMPRHSGPQAYSHQASAFVFTPSSSAPSPSSSSSPSVHSSSPSIHAAHSTVPGSTGPNGGHQAYCHQASAFAFTPSSSPSVPSSSSSSSAPTSSPSTHSAPSAPSAHSTVTVHPGPRLGPQPYSHQGSAFGFNPSSSPSVPSAPSPSPSAPTPHSSVPGHPGPQAGPQAYPTQASAFGFARSSSSPGRGAEGGGAPAGPRALGEPAEGRDGAESPAEGAARSPSPEPVVVDMASHASQSARFIRHFDRGLNCCSRTDLFFVPLPGSKLAKKREEVVERARREAEQRLREEKEREREREREKEVERAMKASGEARMQEPIFPGPGAQRAPFEAPATGVAAVPPYLGPDVPGLRPLSSQGVHPLMEPLVGARITYPSPLLGPPVTEHDLLRQHIFGPPYRELPGSLAAPLSAAHQLQAMQAQSAELQRLALEHHQHWLQGVPLPGQEDYYRVWANYFSMRR